jgi:hypothetical protein
LGGGDEIGGDILERDIEIGGYFGEGVGDFAGVQHFLANDGDDIVAE